MLTLPPLKRFQIGSKISNCLSEGKLVNTNESSVCDQNEDVQRNDTGKKVKLKELFKIF